MPPGSAPPLRLPDDPAAGPLRGGASGRRRWLRALTPLAAAAAVAAVVIASLSPDRPHAARRLSRARRPGPARCAASRRTTSRSPAWPDAPDHAVIRATATGAVLATVQPPRPYGSFTFVSGAADDRTFVLAAQRWWNVTSGTRGEAAQQRDNTTPVAFFRLRFDPRDPHGPAHRRCPAAGRSSSLHLSGLGACRLTAASWP